MKSCDVIEVDESSGRAHVVGGGAAHDLALLSLARGSDLALVQKTAEQQAQLAAMSERVDELQAQRRWLWGGLGVSAAVFAILLLRRRRPETPKPRGQLSSERQAA